MSFILFKGFYFDNIVKKQKMTGKKLLSIKRRRTGRNYDSMHIYPHENLSAERLSIELLSTKLISAVNFSPQP